MNASRSSSTPPRGDERPLTDVLAGLGAEGEGEPGAALEKADARARLFGRPAPRLRIGRYTVTRRLGAGGMGEVFAGHDDSLDRPVAIKLLHRDLDGDDASSRARMIREAKTLAKLSHPNVVQVYEVGESEGRVFIAMELIAGTTLTQWLQTQYPGWRVTLQRYLEAGRGLVAVHHAGLVHRDFKPDNVLVGDDDRVCVADFGLARHASSPSTHECSGPGAPSSADDDGIERLTRTGLIVGTPAYMAPEQIRMDEIDERADQYAFCVALYEGLYGRRPFEGRSLKALVAAHRKGLTAPPRRSPVPRRLWRALAKGLSANPEERFDGMQALLRTLDPVRARRRRLVAAAVLLGAPALAGAIALQPEPEPKCELDSSALAETWDDARRDQVDSAFRATALPFAESALANAEASLDRWSTRWLDARRAACEATHLDGTQSQERLDARFSCLERQRRVVAVRTRVLAHADARVVGRSDRVLAELPDAAACSGPELLDELYPLPGDEATARSIESARDQLARGVALLEAGALGQVEAISAEVTAEAERLGYPPLTLEAEVLEGRLLIKRNRLDAGIDALHRVALRAEALHMDDLAATLGVRIARRSAGDWSKPELEHWVLVEAEAALDRAARPNDPRRLSLALARGKILSSRGAHQEAIEVLRDGREQARALGDEAMVASLTIQLAEALLFRGNYEAAGREFLAALDSARSQHGDRSPLVGDIEFDIALLDLQRGEQGLQSAAQHLAIARSIFEETFGPQSLDAVRVLFVETKLAMNRGALDEAMQMIAQVLTTYEHELGSDHIDTAQALNARGTLRFFAHQHADALTDWRRALAIERRVRGPRHEEVGLLISNIGESLYALGRLDEALESFDEALAIMRDALPLGHQLLALPTKARGLVLLDLGRRDEAIVELERALAIHDAHPAEPNEHAETRFALARALRPRDPARAAALSERARKDFEALARDDRREAVDRWIEHTHTTEAESTK